MRQTLPFPYQTALPETRHCLPARLDGNQPCQRNGIGRRIATAIPATGAGSIPRRWQLPPNCFRSLPCYDFGMERRFRPNRFEAFAVVAVVVTTMLCLDLALNSAHVYTSVQTMSAWYQVLAVLGWLIATFGPITTSIVFWRLSKRLRKAWIVHLLVLPLAYAMVSGGASLMLFATGDRTGFDNVLGGPVIQAGILFILTVIGYYSAAFYAVFNPRSKTTSGS